MAYTRFIRSTGFKFKKKEEKKSLVPKLAKPKMCPATDIYVVKKLRLLYVKLRDLHCVSRTETKLLPAFSQWLPLASQTVHSVTATFNHEKLVFYIH